MLDVKPDGKIHFNGPQVAFFSGPVWCWHFEGIRRVELDGSLVNKDGCRIVVLRKDPRFYDYLGVPRGVDAYPVPMAAPFLREFKKWSAAQAKRYLDYKRLSKGKSQ